MRWHIPHEEEHLELFSMATLQLQGTATAAVLSISEAAGPEMWYVPGPAPEGTWMKLSHVPFLKGFITRSTPVVFKKQFTGIADHV